MTLRILSAEQLEHVSPHVRVQLEQHLALQPKHAEQVVERRAEAAGRQGVRLARPEQECCRLLVQWIDALVLPNGLKPGLFLCHTANGGWRSDAEAGIFIGQGVRPGWPDYTLYIPRGAYHGLVLEMKAEDGKKPEDHQLEILSRLESMGYKAAVCWGFEEARRAISAYLGIPY